MGEDAGAFVSLIWVNAHVNAHVVSVEIAVATHSHDVISSLILCNNVVNHTLVWGLNSIEHSSVVNVRWEDRARKSTCKEAENAHEEQRQRHPEQVWKIPFGGEKVWQGVSVFPFVIDHKSSRERGIISPLDNFVRCRIRIMFLFFSSKSAPTQTTWPRSQWNPLFYEYISWIRSIVVKSGCVRCDCDCSTISYLL